MNVEKELQAMSQRIFNQDYDRFIQSWLTEQEEDSYFADIEGDYKKAISYLSQHMDETQSGELAGLERLFKERQKYAVHYCFSCGQYAVFEQFFGGDGADDDAFHRLVEEGLMTIPGMERHVSFHENAIKCLALIKHLCKVLGHEGEEHIISIESAWEERIHSAALSAFYCGYRAGLAVLERIKPIGSLHMAGHLLMTEYELGLTTTYQQRERLIA